jgi:hypothetical protein
VLGYFAAITQGHAPMSSRCTTLILPAHNIQTLRVLVAIIASEGETDDVAKMSDSARLTADVMANGFATRKEAEGFSDILQTHNLHLTFRCDSVRYKAGKYRPQTMRVQMSAYSCDPYGRETITRIVDSTSVRY